MDLAGKTAIVTGASRGIGLAIAQSFAAAGANVVLTARTAESASAAAAWVSEHRSEARARSGANPAQPQSSTAAWVSEHRSEARARSGANPAQPQSSTAAAEVGGEALGIAAHVVDEEAAQRCVEQTIDRFGSLDILVNNAGTNPAFGPLIDQDHGRFAKIFDVNLWAPILWSSLAVRAWMGEHGGSIINTASIGGLGFEPNIGLYNASKAALIHVTKQLALELSPKVRVNAIAPGVVRTKLAETLWKEHEGLVASATALGRIGEPEDIAAATTFLASDAASWVTGETFVIDGGQRLGNAALFR